MTSTPAPYCLGCTHYRRSEDFESRCAAFPWGIPGAIWGWQADHRAPYEGDHGIQFEENEEEKENELRFAQLLELHFDK